MKRLALAGLALAFTVAGCHDSPTEPVLPTPTPTPPPVATAAREPVLAITGLCGDPYAAPGSTDALPGYFIQNTGGPMPDAASAALYQNGSLLTTVPVRLGPNSYTTLHFQFQTGTFGLAFTYRGATATYTKECNGWVLPTPTPTPSATPTTSPTASSTPSATPTPTGSATPTPGACAPFLPCGTPTPTPTGIPTVIPTPTPGACPPGPGGVC